MPPSVALTFSSKKQSKVECEEERAVLRGEEGELEYYEETLRRHHGLVSETRRQFELLRPEHFRRIRRLEDGEDVDLEKAISFIIDNSI